MLFLLVVKRQYQTFQKWSDTVLAVTHDRYKESVFFFLVEAIKPKKCQIYVNVDTRSICDCLSSLTKEIQQSICEQEHKIIILNKSIAATSVSGQILLKYRNAQNATVIIVGNLIFVLNDICFYVHLYSRRLNLLTEFFADTALVMRTSYPIKFSVKMSFH